MAARLNISERFTQNVGKAFGREGEAWLGGLPALLADLARAVLSACWSAEDGGNGWQGAIAVAEAAAAG